MKVVIETPFTIDEKSNGQIHDKLQGLEEYKMGITQIDVYFKIDDGEVNKVAVSQIEIRKPGNTIFASGSDKIYMKAFHEAFSKAKRQLLKKKEVLKSH